MQARQLECNAVTMLLLMRYLAGNTTPEQYKNMQTSLCDSNHPLRANGHEDLVCIISSVLVSQQFEHLYC